MADKIKLIVGLGNPGPDYTDTRHNAGFWFIDRLARSFQCQFSRGARFSGEISRIQTDRINCRLLKPMTFMNESGRAVQAVLNYYHIEAQEMLVVHDEIDFEPGTVRLKKGGGHAGHNGLRNIISCIDDKHFLRIRIGVGHPGQKDRVVGSVLGRPSKDDKILIDQTIDQALDVMPLIFEGDINEAMKRLHTDE